MLALVQIKKGLTANVPAGSLRTLRVCGLGGELGGSHFPLMFMPFVNAAYAIYDVLWRVRASPAGVLSGEVFFFLSSFFVYYSFCW